MRLSLRWKIVGGFGILLTLIALLGWVILSLFGSLRDVQHDLIDEAFPASQAVDEIIRSYTAQSDSVSNFLIGSSIQPALLEQYRSEVEAATFWEERAARLFTEEEERALLGELQVTGESFQRLVAEEVIPRVRRGDRSQAIRVFSGEGRPLVSEIGRVGSLLRDTQDIKVADSEDDLQSQLNQTLLALVMVTLTAFVVGLSLAIALPRRLVGNLSRLVEAARAIGRGNLDQVLDITSGDEVEELAERFGEMQAGLKRLQQLALHDRELEIAATIQRNLLQRTLPITSGVRLEPLQRQANLVGGDWYDVDLSGRELTVVVGDASGKGIAAALMATVALSFLRAERGLGATPRRVVERANEALREATDPGSFTTLIYCTVDVHSGEVRWLNMGHPSPFIIRAAAEKGSGPRGYYLEGPRNRALGWYEEPGLAETVMRLNPGDRLILFTDGWLEARSSEGEVFGEHRFAEAIVQLAPLDTPELGTRLVAEVESFAAGKLEDDLTMLVIEFLGVSPGRSREERQGEETWHSRR